MIMMMCLVLCLAISLLSLLRCIISDECRHNGVCEGQAEDARVAVTTHDGAGPGPARVLRQPEGDEATVRVSGAALPQGLQELQRHPVPPLPL